MSRSTGQAGGRDYAPPATELARRWRPPMVWVSRVTVQQGAAHHAMSNGLKVQSHSPSIHIFTARPRGRELLANAHEP